MSTTESKTPENVAQLAQKRVPKSKSEAILGVLLLVSRLPLATQLLLASLGLALAIFCGVMLLTKLFNNQDSLARTLPATLVSTAYPHRGVTAFLTANLDEKAESEKNNTELSVAIGNIAAHIGKLNTFDKGWEKRVIQSLNKTVEVERNSEAERNSNDLSVTVRKPADHLKNPKTRRKDWEDSLIEYLDLDVRNKPNVPSRDQGLTWTQIIHSKHLERLGRPAFLMVPAISLRQTEVGPNGLKGQLREGLRHNSEILFDFYIASQIQPELDNLGVLPHQPFKIVQAYFISESGVILLRKLPDSSSYEDTFPNNTLFMDRLYFWGAINPGEFRQTKNNQGPLDYETEPYIDLGGNGVVKTNSKRVELPNGRTGVICVDVVLPNTQEQIVHRLNELGGIVTVGRYIETPGNAEGPSKVTLEAAAGDSGFDWVKNLSTTPSSRITGAIAFEEDFSPPSEPDVVRFTVPMGSNSPKGATVTNLLLVTFYFQNNKQGISLYTTGLVMGIGFFIFVMGNLLLQHFFLTKEMNQVLINMSQVMDYATTPFVWLDENNEFKAANLSFLNTVGYDNINDLKNHAPRFKDLVAPESLPTYEEILALSGKGEPTPEYWIKIVTAKHKKISVLAHGERIPYPTLGRKREPHRFGVLLPESADPEKRQSHLAKIGADDAEENATSAPSDISD